MSVLSASTRLSLKKLQARVEKGEKLAMLTAYDAITAALLDQAGIDLILVGDSLGNVVLGFENTIPVTLDDMIRHSAAVVRGTRNAFIVCDMPFGTTTDPDTALKAAVRIFQASGAQAVKIEGGAWAAPIVHRLVEQGIPVMAHIGLTPQSIHQLGGYHRHGKTEDDARKLLDAALALQDAGAFSIVLECVMPEVSREISERLTIPTIGIGSGTDCDGQVLVINDLIGLAVRPAPSFARPRADAAALIRGAVREYINEVRGGTQHEQT
jgi:3-methyl-2-oxobutanoate hydroxymethyltransferase